MITAKQASLICETHEIDQLMTDKEELELLKSQNPELLAAYRELHKLAAGLPVRVKKSRQKYRGAL